LIQDTQVIAKVKHTGVGSIDPEILSQLFSKFASRSFEGTGLGLFIAKSIVEVHDRKVWIITILIEKKQQLPFTLLYQLSIDNKM
jgi:signal transduction histidine kinase